MIPFVVSKAADPRINSEGIVAWAVKNLIPILLLIVGISIIASARKGKMSDNASTITNVVLGCGVIAGGAVLYSFAGGLVDFVFGN